MTHPDIGGSPHRSRQIWCPELVRYPPRVVLGLILLVLGALLAIVGHRSGRMQMRAIGVGLAVFGLVTLLLPIIFG